MEDFKQVAHLSWPDILRKTDGFVNAYHLLLGSTISLFFNLYLSVISL